tara:strand:+ start:580 stop:756 length:177 start_codon:yes stop_codon:yes gene_type:complete
MKLAAIEECPHCSKRLAKALDHWISLFQKGGLCDDFEAEIAEILSDKAQELRSIEDES